MQEAAEAGQEAGAGARHNVSLSSSDTDPRSRLSPAGPGKLTVRAMPDPDSSFNTDRLESLQSAEHIRSVYKECCQKGSVELCFQKRRIPLPTLDQ